MRRFERFCLEAEPCQLARTSSLLASQDQHTLLGAVISSCLVASAPTPVSPLGSLPRLELFLLRPALWMLVLLPFWDDDRLLLGLLGAIAGKGSVFLVAMIVGVLVVQQCSKANGRLSNRERGALLMLTFDNSTSKW